MKRTIFLLAFFMIGLTAMSQNLELRLRGGINFQQSKTAEGDYSFMPHIGAMAGVRISTFGIYGEFLYSVHDNQNWDDNAAYLVPSAVFRFYAFRMVYMEAGLSYYILNDDQIDGALISFPDKETGFIAGIGLNVRSFEVGLRTTSEIASIQLTASYRF